jgi:ribosome-associated protein
MLGQVGIRWQQQSVRQAAVGPAKGNSGAKGLETLSPVEISRAERRVPEAVSRMRVDAEEILRLVLHRLDEMKAEDTLTIDLRDKSSIGDYMVVSSGRSHRHVGSVADRVIEDLRNVGVRARVEGTPHCDWVLIDAGDVIVHVFRPEVRDFYNLEKMWMAGRPARRAS